MNDWSTGLLLFLLAIAAWQDIKNYRIPNLLVLIGMIAGVILHSNANGWPGFLHAVQGMLVGMAVLLPMYLLRLMGAGDVKLMGMAGAFLGPWQVIGALLAVLVVGGILAILMALRLNKLQQLLTRVRLMVMEGVLKISVKQMPVVESRQSLARMPYGVAIFIGVAAYMLLRHKW